MQTYRRPDGTEFEEVISAPNKTELNRRLRENQTLQEAKGNKFLGERMLTRNSKCTCGSGKKIKRCCKYIR